MDFVLVKTERFQELVNLQIAYKTEIGEDCPSKNDFEIAKKLCEENPKFRNTNNRVTVS